MFATPPPISPSPHIPPGGAERILRLPAVQVLQSARLHHFRAAPVTGYSYHTHALVDLAQPAFFAWDRWRSVTAATDARAGPSSAAAVAPVDALLTADDWWLQQPFLSSCAQALLADDDDLDPPPAPRAAAADSPADRPTHTDTALWPVFFGGAGAAGEGRGEGSADGAARPLQAHPWEYSQGLTALEAFATANGAVAKWPAAAPGAVELQRRMAAAAPSPAAPLPGLPAWHGLRSLCPRDATCLLSRVLLPSSALGFYHHTERDWAWKERALLALRLFTQQRMGVWQRSLYPTPLLIASPAPSPSPTLSAAPAFLAAAPLEVLVFARAADETGVHCPRCCFGNHAAAIEALARAFPALRVRTAVPRHQSLREQVEAVLSASVLVGVDGGAFDLLPFARAGTGVVLLSRLSAPSSKAPGGVSHFNHDSADARYVGMWSRRLHVRTLRSVAAPPKEREDSGCALRLDVPALLAAVREVLAAMATSPMREQNDGWPAG